MLVDPEEAGVRLIVGALEVLVEVLVTTFEPCAMCTGTIYWANIGTLVYGVAETKLLELTGASAMNPTINLSSRTVIAAGQKPITVHGPIPELEEELMAPHRDFWRK